MVLAVDPKFPQMLCGVQWPMPTALEVSRAALEDEGGGEPSSQSSGSLGSPGLLSGLQGGQNLELVRPGGRSQGEERKGGGCGHLSVPPSSLPTLIGHGHAWSPAVFLHSSACPWHL